MLSRYLRILRVPRREPGLAALAELTSAHLRRVPFENVSKLYHRKDAGMRLPDLVPFLDGIERHHLGGTCSLPLDLEQDHEVRWGSDRYVLKPRDGAGRSRVELYRDGGLRHGYQVDPRPRRIQEFERVIAASFDEGATFMNALMVARFSPGRSATLRNQTLSETREGRARAPRTLGRDGLPATVERHFGIPEAITRQALEGVSLTAGV